MKKMIFAFAFAFVFSALSFACPNYSGHYQGIAQKSDQHYDIVIEQVDCEHATMDVTNAGQIQSRNVIFDGVVRY
ncbi:MAG: hypothetical protein WCG27_09300, partial [Pseudomonadota bacterium]